MFGKVINYLKESRRELAKVIWPSRKQTRDHTLMVIAVSLGIAIFLGVVDYLLNELLALVI